MAVKQLHLADTGNVTTATPEPVVVCMCLEGGDPFVNKPDFQCLSSNLYLVNLCCKFKLENWLLSIVFPGVWGEKMSIAIRKARDEVVIRHWWLLGGMSSFSFLQLRP